jgi:hypothetical protein
MHFHRILTSGTKPNKKMRSKTCVFAMANLKNPMWVKIRTDDVISQSNWEMKKTVICLSVSPLLGCRIFSDTTGDITNSVKI